MENFVFLFQAYLENMHLTKDLLDKWIGKHDELKVAKDPKAIQVLPLLRDNDIRLTDGVERQLVRTIADIIVELPLNADVAKHHWKRNQ